MLRSTFRKLLAKEEANKPDVLTWIRYIVTLVAIILYLNYLSNEGLFSLFSFFEVASSFFLFFLWRHLGTALGKHFRVAD